MTSKKISIQGLSETITITIPDKLCETLHKELEILPQLKNTHFLITNEDASVYYLPFGTHDLKGNKLWVRILSKDQTIVQQISKLCKKWAKRKNYHEIFVPETQARYKERIQPHYLLPFATDAQTIKALLQSLSNDDIAAYTKFFQIEEFCDSKKSQKREILLQFLNSVLIDQIDEKTAKLYLEFKPPLFLNESLGQFYIGNLYSDKNLMKKWKIQESIQLKFLLILYKYSEFAEIDQKIAEIVKTTEENGELLQKFDLICSNFDGDSEIRKMMLETLLSSDETQILKKDELIKKISKNLKDILRIPDGKREEFKPEIKKLAWIQNCKSMKASKSIPLLDQYFKLDNYGGVISNLAISCGVTGIQFDHNFPDNLGGPNTLQNATPIHWLANNRKSDTPKEFVNLKPTEKDWFSEKNFLQCVKEYGIFVTLGRTPFGLPDDAVDDLKKIEEEIKDYDPKNLKNAKKEKQN